MAFIPESTEIVELAGLGGLIEEATRSGCKALPILWQTVTKPTPQVTAILKLRERSKIVKILWMLKSNGMPASLCTSCFPADLWAQWVGRDLSDLSSSYRLLRQQLGPHVKRAREIIDCRRAPKWVASLLQIEPATAVIACEREVFLEDGTPVEYATAYARGDLLKFAFERRRQEQEHSAVTGAVRTPVACLPIDLTIQRLPSID